ncbi:MAG: hypothetical protein IIU73_00165 [Selenomonadales bacterium]|nr:hypothetical protein [Selenomonadales bacterium]
MRMSRRLALYGVGGAFSEKSFTYSGAYDFIDQGDGNWMVRFKTRGMLTLKTNIAVDVWALGGGGGGDLNGGGAGSGYCGTVASNLSLAKGDAITIEIGAGGAGAVTQGDGNQHSGSTGGTTSFKLPNGTTYSKTGGKGSGKNRAQYSERIGGNGGSGGGGYGAGKGGTNGSNGEKGNYANGGTGQGSSTYEFADTSLVLKATGGNAMDATSGKNKSANTGDGGDSRSSNSANAYNGGSGLLIIRNAREVA